MDKSGIGYTHRERHTRKKTHMENDIHRGDKYKEGHI